jgi:NitT/TauT family transport system permease protein
MEHLEENRAGSAAEPAGSLVNGRWRPKLPDSWIPALITLVGLLAWEWGAHVGRISPLFFPAPTVISRTIFTQMVYGTLLQNLLATLSRVSLGLLFGGSAGILLGLAIGASHRLRIIVEPFIAATHPIPKIAILPLILILMGIGESTKIFVAAMGAFFPLVINTAAGVRQIHKIYFEVAQNYGASRTKVLLRVILPGSLPAIMTGLLLATNITLLLTIAVEMVTARDGLGASIWMAWQTMRSENLWASLLLIALLGVGFNLLVRQLAQLFIPWQDVAENQ